MRYLLLLLTLVIVAGPVPSQTPRPTGPRRVAGGTENLPTDRKAQESLRNLHDLEVPRTKDKELQNLQAIYGKPSKDDTAILTPSPESIKYYAEFLKQKETGAFKLNANDHCGQNAEVVSGDETCLKFKIPGGGTAYSFRYNTYRIQRLADLILQKDVIKTDGVLQQGVMVDLGDVPIESIDRTSKGLKYLVNFKPATTNWELDKMSRDLINGIEADGNVYSMGFYARAGHTYVLRSIAFDGTYVRSQSGTPYDEMLFDKRQDVLVAFRVIAVDPDGNITIVWRGIDRRDAPKLKVT